MVAEDNISVTFFSSIFLNILPLRPFFLLFLQSLGKHLPILHPNLLIFTSFLFSLLCKQLRWTRNCSHLLKVIHSIRATVKLTSLLESVRKETFYLWEQGWVKTTALYPGQCCLTVPMPFTQHAFVAPPVPRMDPSWVAAMFSLCLHSLQHCWALGWWLFLTAGRGHFTTILWGSGFQDQFEHGRERKAMGLAAFSCFSDFCPRAKILKTNCP